MAKPQHGGNVISVLIFSVMSVEGGKVALGFGQCLIVLIAFIADLSSVVLLKFLPFTFLKLFEIFENEL